MGMGMGQPKIPRFTHAFAYVSDTSPRDDKEWAHPEWAHPESQLQNEYRHYYMWYRLFVPTPQVNKVPKWDFVRVVYWSTNSYNLKQISNLH